MHCKKSDDIFLLKYFIEINPIYITNQSKLFLKTVSKCIGRNYEKFKKNLGLSMSWHTKLQKNINLTT